MRPAATHSRVQRPSVVAHPQDYLGLGPQAHPLLPLPASRQLLQQNRGVHYQIIDHRVYRASKCMFSARCEGVEHFLHQLAPVRRASEAGAGAPHTPA